LKGLDGLGVWAWMDMQGQSPKRPHDSHYKFSKKLINSELSPTDF